MPAADRPARAWRVIPLAVGAFALAACAPDLAQERTPRRAEWSRQAGTPGGTERLDASIRYHAGRFELTASHPAELYSAVLAWNAASADAPVHEYEEATGRLLLDMGTAHEHRWRSGEGGADRVQPGSLQVGLSPQRVIALNVAVSATHSEVDLTGLQVERLEVANAMSEMGLRMSEPGRVAADEVRISNRFAQFTSSGLGNLRASEMDLRSTAGAVHLNLSGEWTGDLALRLMARASAVTINIPADVGVSMRLRSRVASIPEGWARNGDRLVSSNWESATHKLTLDGSATLSRVDVNWFPAPDSPPIGG